MDNTPGRDHAPEIDPAPKIVVDAPRADGGRRVWIGHDSVGLAYGRIDVLEFARRAGLDPDQVDLHDPDVVRWRGGGPDDWTADR
ncbi:MULTISPECIES: hypothetical protein [unclassified Streptomyces]|uniref:hypothetical protein n=1 Tax=unclassified Streptomyces TaxID=2593676 RepID=UPI00035F8C49|nr:MULTISPECIES: hypothetical protein [unclassified Streptomyces]